MNKIIILAVLLGSYGMLTVSHGPTTFEVKGTLTYDSLRLSELDTYWTNLSKTVQEGDHIGYQNLYHKDAVVVFAAGKNKSSKSIAKAMKDWRQGFLDTKSGKVNSLVEFRFSQRINDEDSAHETGIFKYTSSNGNQPPKSSFVHFDMLLVKRDGRWLGVMEYQKAIASKAEWVELK